METIQFKNKKYICGFAYPLGHVCILNKHYINKETLNLKQV